MIQFGDTRMPPRFWAKIAITDDGCWEWTACIGAGGYARYGTAHSTSAYAHKVAYETLVDSVPEGLNLDHRCHTDDKSCPGGHCRHRRCVNPAHLEPVTSSTNARRGRGISATHAAKTHCINGHPFDEQNTRIRTFRRPSGKTATRRECIVCERARRKELAA